MAYFTIPLMVFLTIWVVVSLRTGRFTLYLRRGPRGFMGMLQDWDTLQYTRRNEPVSYWIGVGLVVALDVACAAGTAAAMAMGIGW